MSLQIAIISIYTFVYLFLEALADGAVYANLAGEKGWCPARKVDVVDTTGAGDSFCAGAVIGMTYGSGMRQGCEIGSMLAASVIVTMEAVCPRFLPRELGLDMEPVEEV